jgi:hypothetical membrane protein
MNPTEIKRSTYILFTGIVVFAICWIAAVLIDGTWIYGVDVMSKLGISDSFAKYIFLIGCVEAGICIFIYGFIMARETRMLLRRVVYYIFQIAGFLLMGVGVFTMDYDIHGFFAVTFFAMIGISVIIYAIYAALQKNRLLCLTSTGVAIAGILMMSFTPLAFVESTFVILFLIWILIIDLSEYTCKNDCIR